MMRVTPGHISIELQQCEENDVPDMLEAFDLGKDVTFSELADMGWQGQVMYSANTWFR